MYWPPTCGSRDPSSAQMNPPSSATPPPIVHASRISSGECSTRATFDGFAKMPTPMMPPATITTASSRPSSRRNPASGGVVMRGDPRGQCTPGFSEGRIPSRGRRLLNARPSAQRSPGRTVRGIRAVVWRDYTYGLLAGAGRSRVRACGVRRYEGAEVGDGYERPFIVYSASCISSWRASAEGVVDLEARRPSDKREKRNTGSI